MALFVGNFSPTVRTQLPHRPAARRPLARGGQHRLGYYGGSGVGNMGGVDAEAIGWHGQPLSAEVTLPPLAALWLVP